VKGSDYNDRGADGDAHVMWWDRLSVCHIARRADRQTDRQTNAPASRRRTARITYLRTAWWQSITTKRR